MIVGKDLGAGGCSAANPCDEGEGDCNSRLNGEDCKGNLNCYERRQGESVPGIILPPGF